MHALIEDSSDEEGEGENAIDEEDDEWGLGDDALVHPVHEGPIDVTVTEEAHGDNKARHDSRERRGVPLLRFIEMYLAAAAEEEVKKNPQSVEKALNSSQGDKWQEAMDS